MRKFPALLTQRFNMKPRIKNTVMKNGKRYVCRIFDIGNGDPEYKGYCDRYTIALKGWYLARHGMVYPYLASNKYPLIRAASGNTGKANLL